MVFFLVKKAASPRQSRQTRHAAHFCASTPCVSEQSRRVPRSHGSQSRPLFMVPSHGFLSLEAFDRACHRRQNFPFANACHRHQKICPPFIILLIPSSVGPFGPAKPALIEPHVVIGHMS